MDTAPLTGAGPGLEGGAAGASARGAQWGGVGGGGLPLAGGACISVDGLEAVGWR